MVMTRRSSAAGSARVGSARGASRVPTEAKLVFAVAGIFFAFGAFAVLQEDVYRTSYAGERFSATFLVLIVERGVNTAVGALGALLLARSGGDERDRKRSPSEKKTRVPVAAIATSGISQMLAMAFANEALRFVSFPTQVLGKSCKMIPVMIGGVVAGRKYRASQYAQVAVVTAGVVAFNLGKPRRDARSPSHSGAPVAEDSAYGLALIAASLAMDLVTAALQDRVKTATARLNPRRAGADAPKTSMFESMLWTNAGGACAAFALAAGTGQLGSGLAFCARHVAAAKNVAFYALASVIGQLFVYFTITEFDPLVLSTVTTTRKIFSTVYSAARSPEAAMTRTQWGGCAAVFAAIAWDTLEKYRRAHGAKRLGGKKDA